MLQIVCKFVHVVSSSLPHARMVNVKTQILCTFTIEHSIANINKVQVPPADKMLKVG